MPYVALFRKFCWSSHKPHAFNVYTKYVRAVCRISTNPKSVVSINDCEGKEYKYARQKENGANSSFKKFNVGEFVPIQS